MNILLTHVRRHFRSRLLIKIPDYRHLKLSIVEPSMVHLYEDLIYQGQALNERLSFLVFMIMIKQKRPEKEISKMANHLAVHCNQFQNFMTMVNLIKELVKVPDILTEKIVEPIIKRSLELFEKACFESSAKYRNRDSVIIFQYLGHTLELGYLPKVLTPRFCQLLTDKLHEHRSRFLFGFLDILTEAGLQHLPLFSKILDELESIEICLGQIELQIIETHNFRKTINHPRFDALCDRLENTVPLTKRSKLKPVQLHSEVEPIM